MSRPDLHLIERRSRLCRLAGDEVRYLLAHHAGILDIAPTQRRGIWRLTPGGVVGVVQTPFRRLILSPKMAVGNLLYLLDPLRSDHPGSNDTPAATGDAVIRLLAGRFITLLRERLAAGLHRDYRERTHAGPVLLGRLDVAAQMRQSPNRRDQLHSQIDDFTDDILSNQVVRAVGQNLLRSPVLDADLRLWLAQTMAILGDLSEVEIDSRLIYQLNQRRDPVGYGPLLDLCRVLAGSHGGTGSTPSLLVSLEQLFERYLSRAVEEAAGAQPELTVRIQTTYPADEQSPALQLRPDVTIESAGRPVVVVDAKWKRLPEGGQIPSDVYQALSYAAFLGARRAVLVYPGRRRQVREYAPQGMNATVEVRTVDVSGTLARCQRARRRLQRVLLVR